MISRDTPKRGRIVAVPGRRLALPALIVIAAVLAGCSSSTHSSTPAPGAANGSSAAVSTAKSTFCGDDVALDKAQIGVSNATQELQALKAHPSFASDLGQAASKISDPNVAKAAQQIDAAVTKALSSGSVNFSSNIGSDATIINTYCGVQFNGTPLPPYFAAGKGSPICTQFVSLYNQLRSATSPQAYLSLIQSNQAQIDRLVSQAPATVKNQAGELKTALNQVVAQKNPGPMETPAVMHATADIQFYCGIND